jgi:hypothetical protein
MQYMMIAIPARHMHDMQTSAMVASTSFMFGSPDV